MAKQEAKQGAEQKIIALYIGSLSKGGAERVIINLADYFQHEGYRVLLLTARVDKEEYRVPEGVIRLITEPKEKELAGGRVSNFAARFRKLRNIWKGTAGYCSFFYRQKQYDGNTDGFRA